MKKLFALLIIAILMTAAAPTPGIVRYDSGWVLVPEGGIIVLNHGLSRQPAIVAVNVAAKIGERESQTNFANYFPSYETDIHVMMITPETITIFNGEAEEYYVWVVAEP